MTMLPPKVLLGSFSLDALNPTNAVWTENRPNWMGNMSSTFSPSPDLAYQAYRWNAVIQINQQSHYSSETREPFAYNGLDIKVGDWMADIVEAKAVKIVEITSQNYDIINCVVEDVESYNFICSDPGTGGSGIGGFGTVVVFSLGEDGTPILGPSSASAPIFAFNPAFFQDLTSRFQYRNTITSSTVVVQPGHTFNVGDIIFMDTDGIYKQVAVSVATKDQLERIVGEISSVNFPTTDFFTYRARGKMRHKVEPQFPADSLPGQLMYLDPNNPGSLTHIKPKLFATPIYIRLETLDKGIFLSGGAGGAAAGPLGYYASNYRVADLAERDLIDAEQLQLGDQVFVADAGQGEWAHFMVTGKTEEPVTITWTKLVDQDSSTVDARTIKVDITKDSDVSTDLYSVSPLTRVTVITVEVMEPFHHSATLNIGTVEENDLLVSNDDVDLGVEGTYSITPSYQFGGDEEELIKVFLDKGPSSFGHAVVTMSYM